jgi:distribution and morphology protein 10
MYNFATWLTRTYHQSIGWNEDNLYSNLTRSSSGVCNLVLRRCLCLTDCLMLPLLLRFWIIAIL